MELEGRVILVTGGARRIGQAIAERLAERRAVLAIHYRSSQPQAEQTAARCRQRGAAAAAAFPADLADPGSAPRLIERVLGEFGRLDVLINNASVFAPLTLDDFDLAAWNATLQVNLTAPLQLVHAARDPLRAARGRVINLCDAATGRPWPDHLAYMASKGALETLTAALARALAPEVTVNGVAPGVAAWPKAYPAERRAELLRRVPLQRAGEPADVAAAVEYLLRDGDYLTGVVLPVDGGRRLV